MTNLCTLFDYNYMDRGIALYQSLKKYAADFRLYILCMDQMTYDTLNFLLLKRLFRIIIKYL